LKFNPRLTRILSNMHSSQQKREDEWKWEKPLFFVTCENWSCCENKFGFVSVSVHLTPCSTVLSVSIVSLDALMKYKLFLISISKQCKILRSTETNSPNWGYQSSWVCAPDEVVLGIHFMSHIAWESMSSLVYIKYSLFSI